MPQNAIVYCMKVLPCPVCTVHSLFEISDVKMFVERDSILFSCCFHVVFSVLFPFFSASRVWRIVWPVHYGRVRSQVGRIHQTRTEARPKNMACRFAAKTLPKGKEFLLAT